MTKKQFPEGFFAKDRPIAKPRFIDADDLRECWLNNGENERVYNTNDFLDSIDEQPTADVQPVVYCKDCIHRHDPDVCPMCTECWSDRDGENIQDLTEDDNFCKYGKPKNRKKEQL
jgi:hypothetical protein